MLPWLLLDRAPLAGGHELRLMQRGSEFSIMLGSNELMNSRLSGSEEALATLVADRLRGRTQPRILIGGLGMGFTLRAALAAFSPDSIIMVSEVVPEVIGWARDAMATVFGGCLDDRRVTVMAEDVSERITGSARQFDAILLDVDNGPDGLTLASNSWLYEPGGLAIIRKALREGGVFAVWSAGPDAAFTKRLRRAGFVTEEIPVRASRSKRGARHMIWIARR